MFYKISTTTQKTNIEEKTYFVYSYFPISTLENHNPIPNKVRILIDDNYERIFQIEELNPLEYLYYKYIKHDPTKVNWEKL